MPPLPTWRSLDDAAAATGVHRRTLQRWVKLGLLTPYRIRGDRRMFLDLDQIKKVREPTPRESPKEPRSAP